MKYYDSYTVKSIYGAAFLTLSSILGLSINHQDELSLDLYWLSRLLIPIWFLSFVYFVKSVFIPRLQIFKTEIIIFGFKKQVLSMDQVKELSLNANFVFISYRENGQIKKINFSILKTSKLNHIYIFNGKFQKFN